MIEDGFWMDLEPAPRVPATIGIPPRAPDGIIKADHKQVNMIRGSSDCCDRLGRMIEDGFWMDLEPGLPGRGDGVSDMALSTSPNASYNWNISTTLGLPGNGRSGSDVRGRIQAVARPLAVVKT